MYVYGHMMLRFVTYRTYVDKYVQKDIMIRFDLVYQLIQDIYIGWLYLG